MATVTAPFDGIVEVVYQKAGEIGAPGRQILHLVSLQSLKVTADISESYLPYVHEGDTVIITFPTFPDITIQAPIKMVGSVVNPNNRTIKISSDVQNITNKLKPNIIAIIKIKDQEFNSALIIPSIVVKSDAKGQNYVYVVNNDSETTFAQKVFVKTGKSYENKTMVLSGLSVDQLLITQGYNLVKNGSLINVKN
jgi:RND family efflux transporter MFP subunit